MDTTPYWITSASLPTFPRPDKDITVDVAIVGGGITGLTAAYLLKKQGLTVAVIERARCATIDTGHTTAHLTAVTDERFYDLKKHFGQDAARAVWDAGGAAIDQIVNLTRAEDIACDFRWVPGYLHASIADEEAAKRAINELRDEATALRELEIRASFEERVPTFGVAGIKFAHQALFHPRKYLSALARTIPGDGSFIFEHSSADEIEESPLSVKTGNVRVTCGHLIIATHNPLMGTRGALSSALFQTKLALYTSYAIGARLPSEQMPEALFWDTSEPYYYLRVERRRGHDYAIFGGEDHKTGQVEDTAALYARLEQKLRSFAPEATVDHRWSGQVIETSDGLPFIGETSEKQFIATGYAGNGMTFGTLGAMMAVDHIFKRTNPWADLFDVHRKKLRGSTWTYLKENKDYPYYLLRNWLAKSEGDSVKEVAPGEGKIISLDGKKVAAYRSTDGKLSLCSPVCTHLQCIVDWNNAEQSWDCPCHGSRFKPNGEVISGPAEEPLERLDAPAVAKH